MKIATWNINGIKARLEVAVTWAKEASADVVCLQEIKSVTEAFPAGPFEELGYNVAVHGQKGFNGVAILSKRPFDEIAVRGLPGDESDSHARYIEVCVPRVAEPRAHRRRARLPAGPRCLHVLGLSGRRLAEGSRHPHRPHPGLPASGRPARRRRHRQAHPRLGEALRPRTRVGGDGPGLAHPWWDVKHSG